MAGLSSLKAAVKKKKGSTKKSDVPVVTVSDVCAQAMSDFCAAKKNVTAAQAAQADAEARLTPEADRLRDVACHESGKLSPSVCLTSADNEQRLLFTRKSQFKKIPDDFEDAIREAVGEQKYGEWFKTHTNWTIDASRLTDKLAAKLMKALGPDVDIIESETVLVPTEQFVRDAMFDPSARRVAEELKESGMVEPFKGSFKIA